MINKVWHLTKPLTNIEVSRGICSVASNRNNFNAGVHLNVGNVKPMMRRRRMMKSCFIVALC